jgi:VCBS repeat protein
VIALRWPVVVVVVLVFGVVSASAAEPIFREAIASPMLNDVVNIASGDLDGDGDPDLATAQQTYGLEVLLNRGDGTLAPGVLAVALGVFNVENLTFGDVDGDGDLDILSNHSPGVDLHRNRGDATFATSSVTSGDTLIGMTLADLDGDGDLDLAKASSVPAGIVVQKNAGNGTFAAGSLFAAGRSLASITTADFDRDGDLDVVVSEQFDARVTLFLNDGAGGLVEGPRLAVAESPIQVVAADLDGDGDEDLAVGFASGVNLLQILKNGGRADFAPPLTIALDDNVFMGSLAAGDLNGDGLLELATALQGSDAVSLVVAQADGGYVRAPDVRVPGNTDPIEDVEILDLDGDGDLDLALAPYHSSQFQVLHNETLDHTLAFSDRTTLVWPRLNGAVSYRVYRGDLADLVDADQDGDPDGGFGECVTGLDPDPADTTFGDPTLPALRTGFFYLMSLVDAGGRERGLGETSAGRPRVPLLPCP